MKKIISFLITLSMSLIMAACMQTGGSPQTGGSSQTGGASQDVPSSQSSQLFSTYDTPSDIQKAEDTKKADETETDVKVKEKGQYTDKERVALYIHTFGHLPDNYITKADAHALGWDNTKGNLKKVAPGKSIGGDRFGNYEGQLPKANKRKYFECDIDYKSGKRNAKRIVFSNDGLIFYTDDHYKTFQQLY